MTSFEDLVEWEEQLPQWKEKGQRPDEEYIENGFSFHEMPPPGWLNWIHNTSYGALEELRWRATEAVSKGDLVSLMQITRTSRLAGDVDHFGLPGTLRKIIDVYEIDVGEDSHVTVHRDFDNTDEGDFYYNENYVEFGEESTTLKTEYESSSTLEVEDAGETEDGDKGSIYSTYIDTDKLDNISNIEFVLSDGEQ